eukprot:TRINITY_DN1414_c0_g2_i2.p1 TRINITY_DN1414_c0_g2~~TRINITY_DN1414_c0_g2_i2.p1  ORF type:complete len:1133 (-),score=442.51 TRINITY_DN1414_c0_g2_i2:192-3590(-)
MSFIKKDSFSHRIRQLLSFWKEKSTAWGNSDAVVVFFGKGDDLSTIPLTEAAETWLFTLCTTNCLWWIEKNALKIIPSRAIKKRLKDFTSWDVFRELDMEVVVEEQPKDMTALGATVKKFVEKLKPTEEDRENTNVGVFKAELETLSSEFCQTFLSELEGSSNCNLVDISFPMSILLRQLDEDGVAAVRKAANASVSLLKNVLKKKIDVAVVKKDGTSTHHDITEEVWNTFLSNRRASLKLPKSVSEDDIEEYDIEECAVMSGGEGAFDLETVQQQDDDVIHPGCVVAMMKANYGGYVASVGRTYFIDATAEQREMYNVLLQVREECLKLMRVGLPVADVWNKAVELLKKRNASLPEKFISSCGIATGILSSDERTRLTGDAKGKFLKESCYAFKLGLVDLDNPAAKDPRSRVYSIYLEDTVYLSALSTKEGQPCEVLSGKARFKYRDIVFAIEEEEKEDGNGDSVKKEEEMSGDDDEDKKDGNDAGDGDSDGDGDGDDDDDGDDDSDEKKKKKQKRIKTENIIEGKRRRNVMLAADVSEVDAKNEALLRRLNDESEEKAPKTISSSRQDEPFKFSRELVEDRLHVFDNPAQVRVGKRISQIIVDDGRDCVIFPVNGRSVPFHISTIKNVTHAGEFLTVNFFTPADGGTVFARDVGTHSNFLGQLAYRSSNTESLAEVSLAIREMIKKSKRVEKEREMEAEGQGDVEIGMPEGQPLNGVHIKPRLTARRDDVGSLQCHRGGLRFTSDRGDRVDFAYSNILHAFCQTFSHGNHMLLHFVVKKPLMMGKRASNHIQVFANIGDDVDHLSGKHARHLSEKESIRMEENEFQLRKKFKKVFRRFAGEIERVMKEHGYTLKFEVPKENLGFQAQFSRGLVNIYPTSSCLVALDEMPFFVLDMKDIEIAFFERLGSLGYSAQTGTFEMTYVYKDYSKEDGFIKLDSIQRYYRDEDEKSLLKDRVVELKKHLLSHNIPFLEQPFALNWKKLMAQIREQIEAVGEGGGDEADEDEGGWKPFSSGGWLAILGGDDESGSEAGSDGGGSDDDDDDGEAEFVPSDAEDANDDDDAEFSEHVDSDSSDDSDDEYADEDSEDGDDEEDWDAQEKRLAQEDRTKRRFDSDEEEEEEDARPVRKRRK